MEIDVKIESTEQTETKCYHLKITYNGDEYFYIVETLRSFGNNAFFIVSEIHRGVSWWDCGKRLKNSEKKAIKNIITKYFTNSING